MYSLCLFHIVRQTVRYIYICVSVCGRVGGLLNPVSRETTYAAWGPVWLQVHDLTLHDPARKLRPRIKCKGIHPTCEGGSSDVWTADCHQCRVCVCSENWGVVGRCFTYVCTCVFTQHKQNVFFYTLNTNSVCTEDVRQARMKPVAGDRFWWQQQLLWQPEFNTFTLSHYIPIAETHSRKLKN